MAKVISWKVNDKFVYLGKQDNDYTPSSSATAQSESFITDLSYYWLQVDTSKEHYRQAYTKLYNFVNGVFTNLNPPGNDGSGADIYYNVLNQKGVMIVSGKDGKDNTDPEAKYYNLHCLSQNIGIGLGGDYKLDVDVSAITEVYIERDGVIKNNEITNIRVPEATTYTWSVLGNTVQVVIKVPKNTSFESSTHNKKYTIIVECGTSYSTYTYFTVTGVKNGAEGAYFNLMIIPKIIKKVGDDYSDNWVDVRYMTNESEGTFAIKYKNNNGEYVPIPSNPIAANFIENLPDSVMTIGLFYDGEMIDSDTCTVTRDGRDAAMHAVVELDNEMDGVALGDDNVLDTAISIGSGAMLMSGTGIADITKVTLKGIAHPELNVADCSVKNGNNWVTKNFDSSKRAIFDISETDKAEFRINFKSGYTFDNYRETITVGLEGDYNGTIITAETNYVIIGVKGGKDGEVFRLQPNVDSSFYDPNYGDYAVDKISCRAFVGLEEIDITQNTDFQIWYSVNVTYESYEELIAAQSGLVHIGNEYDLPQGNSGVTSVAFYLLYKIDENKMFLVDRETVPIIYQGLNGTDRVYLEIEDEIDPVSLGGDYVLNTKTLFETSFTLYSGATAIPFDHIVITVSDDTLNGITCSATTDNGTITAEIQNHEAMFPLQANDGKAEFKIEFGGVCNEDEGVNDCVEFGGDHKKRFTIAAYRDDTSYKAIYTIIGIREGADGVTYTLRPSVDSAVFNPNTGKYDPVSLSCEAYVDSEKIEDHLSNPYSPFYITYTLNNAVVDDDDKESTIELPASGINLIQVGGTELSRVYFYLYYFAGQDDYGRDMWVLLDRESVPILEDGENGINGKDADDRIYLELDEEMTGIATGDGPGGDDVLDTEVTVEIPMSLYSGKTELTFIKLEAEADTEPEANFVGYECTVENNGEILTSITFNEESKWSIEYPGFKYVSVKMKLGPGLKFGDGSRRIVKFTATYGEETFSANYTIIGLKSGKDGVVYRALPQVNEVIYDTNAEEGHEKLLPNPLKCDAFEGSRKIDLSEETDFYLGYKIIENDATDVAPELKTDTDEYNVSGVTMTENIRRVYFCLFIKFGPDWFLLDRESVPVIKQGLNAKNRVYLELDEETTGIGLGGDHKLDLPENEVVPLEIGFNLWSGITPLDMGYIYINGDGSFNGFDCKLYNITGKTEGVTPISTKTFDTNGDVTFTPSPKLNNATIRIELKDGFDFGNDNSKKLTFTVKENAGDTAPYYAYYTVIGVKEGKEGAVYKLMPEANTITLNPNTNNFSPEKLGCSANIGGDEITNRSNSFEDGDENNPYIISYTINSAATVYADTIALESGQTLNIRNIYNSLKQQGEEFERIYFYLYLYNKRGTSGTTLYKKIDMESIPLVANGVDAQTVGYLELDNEMDGIGLENDNVLDTDTVVGTPFCIYSGLQRLDITKVIIEAGEEFNGFYCKLKNGNTLIESKQFTNNSVTFDSIPSGVKIPKVEIYLLSGLRFENPRRKDIQITAFNGDNNFTARYSIIGFPGGADGASFRLVPTVSSIVKNPVSLEYDPSAITCYAYSGIEKIPNCHGDIPDTPSEFDFIITYTIGEQTEDISQTTGLQETGITITSDTRIYFYLWVYYDDGIDGPKWWLIDMESVPIVKDGKEGDQGKKGSAIRGPFNWYDIIADTGHTRYFYNGEGEYSDFIDILIKDGTYYRCEISYEHTHSGTPDYDDWNVASSFWTATTEQFDFVATNLLLATNAKIEFLSNNELYLMYENNIAGGAKGGGANSIIFWAGPTNNGENLDIAPFKVYANGRLEATEGYFSGNLQTKYFNYDVLTAASVTLGSTITLNGKSVDEHHMNIQVDISTGSAGQDGKILILPKPSEYFEGYTIRIVLSQDVGVSHPGLALVTEGLSDYGYPSYTNKGFYFRSKHYHKLRVHGSYIELVCINHKTQGYLWCVTNFNARIFTYEIKIIESGSKEYAFDYKYTIAPMFNYSTDESRPDSWMDYICADIDTHGVDRGLVIVQPSS